MEIPSDLEKLTLQVCDIAREAGTWINNESGRFTREGIESKGVHDFVTYVDKMSENLIVSKLSTLLPEAGFITEENQKLLKNDHLNWIIDPLDGTTNFIHKLPPYSISIALTGTDNILSGVIYEVNLDECFYAWKNGPAYLNDTIINVNNTRHVDEGLFATGFPYYDYSRLEAYMELFIHLLKNSHGLRRLGSAAVDLAYVACGRFEGFYEYGLRPWDVAAGALIVQQAGGMVSDFSGKNNYIFGKEIVATNELLYTEFMEVIKRYFS